MLLQVLLYVVGGLLLMVALALAGASGYLAYIYWKFSHLPSPKRPRFRDHYKFMNLFYNMCFDIK